MDLLGAEEIIKALIKHGTSKDEKRSYQDRYNLIMDALYGSRAENFYIKKDANRPRINTIEHRDYVLLLMFEADQKVKRESFKALAEDFVDQISYGNDRDHAVKRLAAAYSKKLPELHDPEERELIRYFARVQGEQGGYDGYLYEELKELKELLANNGWPISL